MSFTDITSNNMKFLTGKIPPITKTKHVQACYSFSII